MLPGIVLLAALAGLVWVGLAQLSTPDAAPASAPATEFSTERAIERLRLIAAEPRAVGMPGNQTTRQYLIDQIRAMGLEPEVQTATARVRFEGADSFSTGTVNNVVVRIPGTDNTGAIAINVHYDSGSTGPGASDCGSCVVTALETMRSVLAGPALRNDLIFVFSDAEEEGDLGAAAFVQEHRWSDDIRLALNFEAQGTGGPALLYATSDDNGWLVSEFLHAAPNPSAYSLIGAVSDLFPGGQLACDLAEYMKGGIQGLGFVYVSNTHDYHTVRDNIAETDPGSIQQEGENALAFVRHFGSLDLTNPPAAEDRVFFNVLPGVVVHYPFGWLVPLAAATTLMVVALVTLGFRRRMLTAGGLAAGTVALGFGTLVMVALTWLAWFVIRTLNTDYQVTMVGTYQTDLYVVALALLAVALLSTVYALLRRRVGPNNFAAAALVIWLPLLWLMSLALPDMSYIATWPLLFGLLPMAWTLLVRDRAANPWLRVAVLAVAAIPAIILLPATLHQIVALINRFEGMAGFPLLGLSMLFVAPLVVLLIPHLNFVAAGGGRRRWIVPATSWLIALALIGWGNLTSGFDSEHPRPNNIGYTLNADSGQAQWVSFDRNLDSWTGQFFPADTRRTGYETVLWGTFQAYLADAPAVEIPAPEAAVVGDTMNGDIRTLDLRLSSPRAAAVMRVQIDAPGEIVSAAIDGRGLDLTQYDWARDGELKFSYVNVPAEGAHLTLAVRSPDPITLTVEDSTPDLPDIPGMTIPERPPDTMPSPLYLRDATNVVKTYSY